MYKNQDGDWEIVEPAVGMVVAGENDGQEAHEQTLNSQEQVQFEKNIR